MQPAQHQNLSTETKILSVKVFEQLSNMQKHSKDPEGFWKEQGISLKFVSNGFDLLL
jgi:hypothetical protein